MRVKVEASGLCHTDIHAAHGDWPVKPLAAVRPRARGRRDRRRGRPGRDRGRRRRPGRDAVAGLRVRRLRLLRLRAGRRSASSRRTWATRSTARSASTPSPTVATSSRFPTGVDPFDAAPLTCAGVTTYKAVKVAGTRSSDLVAVFGVGGLGHLAIQYAAIAGGRVIAVDIHRREARARPRARRRVHVNATKEDPVEAIQRLGGADQAIALAVSPRAFEQAFGSLRRGGTLVFVAPPGRQRGELPIFETVLNGITSSARSSAPAPTCARSSSCTPPAGPT